MASLSEKIADITVTCISPSKTFNLAGLSTSSLIIPNHVLRKYFNRKIESLHIGNGNIFGTVASIAAYSEGEEWQGELLDYLSKNSEYVKNYCSENLPEILPVTNEATYMMWLDCRKLGMSGKELQEFFVTKAGVGLNEGSGFGPGGEGYMRMNIGTTRQTIEQAMKQIDRAIASIR
jgi:cystathionine beta-lyase